MRQWLFILVGSVGLAVAVSTAAVALLSDGSVPVVPEAASGWVVPVALVGGAGLGAIGFYGGRKAGARRFARAMNASVALDDLHRQGTFAVAAGEVEFACPSCDRTYHAAAGCAGNRFHCRSCNTAFAVPTRPAVRTAAGVRRVA